MWNRLSTLVFHINVEINNALTNFYYRLVTYVKLIPVSCYKILSKIVPKGLFDDIQIEYIIHNGTISINEKRSTNHNSWEMFLLFRLLKNISNFKADWTRGDHDFMFSN